MSMTQEEIEALMNDTASEDADNSNSIDDMLSDIDGIVEDDSQEDNAVDIDDMLADVVMEDIANDDITPDDTVIEEIIKDEESKTKDIPDMQEEIPTKVDDIPDMIPTKTAKDDSSLEEKIDNGVYPLPSSNEHQVVNQLNEVAEDTEKKASLIFDVLSYQLDENEKITANINTNSDFIDSQIELLNQLSTKFPNIQVLKENLKKANDAKINNADSLAIVEEENMKIFEAMELMQYHDINRQKIERVMSVIKKLANYLNSIFVDDSKKSEVQIAKHISGDSADSLNDDDLDSLISEFNK
jgi:hypothetical protein